MIVALTVVDCLLGGECNMKHNTHACMVYRVVTVISVGFPFMWPFCEETLSLTTQVWVSVNV